MVFVKYHKKGLFQTPVSYTHLNFNTKEFDKYDKIESTGKFINRNLYYCLLYTSRCV